MANSSKSAIPVFLFLAIVLIFLPCAALSFVCFRRRHQRRKAAKSRNEATDAVAGNMPYYSASIEMGNIQPPPATIPPIRSMSTKNNPLQTIHEALRPTTEIAAPQPTRSGDRYVDMQYMETAAYTPQNPFSDTATTIPASHYNLQAALVTEELPAQVRTGGERKASLSDAPRVKSQKVKPEHTAAAFEDLPLTEYPPVLSMDAGHYTPGHQPSGWI